jgi:tripartite-type tricarboxylate transporter receptor subunit TctC
MTRKFAIITVFLILAVTSGMVSCTPKTEPVTPTDFYKGKTIDLVTTGSAGSFNDLTTNIIASYLGRDTGATVVVTNRSGSSGLEGMNYLYKAKPDGLTIGSVASVKFVQNKVLNEPAAVYEFDKFSYIMSVDRQPYYFFISPDGPYQSVADLQAGKNLKIGGSSPSGPVSLGGLTVIKLLGLDAKVITGFDTDSDRALAVKRGEIVGYCLNIPNSGASIEAGLIKPMFVLATERDPLAPDVPAITELVKLSGEDLPLVKLWGTAFVASNLIVASPGIPEDRLEFFRSLANKWVQDEGFRNEINAVATYSVSIYLTGDEVAKAMLNMASALDEFQAIFAELIEKYRA